MTQPYAASRRNQRRLGLRPDRVGTESQPTKEAGRGFGLASCSLCWLLALAGCAKLELGENLALWKSDPKPQTPETLSAVWTETTLHQPGKPVVRGFGGRILFHGTDQQQAVPVEGAVIVYGYDNDRPNKEDPAPDKKFVFPAENLTKHQSESSLGPSYSFWLPWDNAGGPQRRISLLTRFEDKSGKIVMSQMAHVTLPGPVALPVPDHAPAVLQGIQPASYEAPATALQQAAASQNASRLRSATIDVAPRQANRLLGAPRTESGRQDPGREIPQPLEGSAAKTATGGGPVSPAPAAALGGAGQQVEPPAGSSPLQSPVQNPPATRLTYDPVRRQPHRGEWPRRLPPTPRSGWGQSEAPPPADGASADR